MVRGLGVASRRRTLPVGKQTGGRRAGEPGRRSAGGVLPTHNVARVACPPRPPQRRDYRHAYLTAWEKLAPYVAARSARMREPGLGDGRYPRTTVGRGADLVAR